MIFPVLEVESVVQISDKTRLDARKVFITPDEAAITLIEIKPEASDSFIDVTSLKYLDWVYSGASRSVTVEVRVTTDGAPVSLTKTISLLIEADDYLFSKDQDLMPYEPNILNWVRDGRASFIDIHRASQDRIMKWLDEHRIWDNLGAKLTKESLVDITEVNDWSKFMTLKLIFEGISNAVDDVFKVKSLTYEKKEIEARNRASLRLDLDGDGELETAKQDLRSVFMVRR